MSLAKNFPLKVIAALRVFPFLVSLVLFLISFLFGSYQVTTIGENSLPAIQLPLAAYSFPTMVIAAGCILFAFCFNIFYRRIEQHILRTRKAIIGSSLFSIGFTVLLFSTLMQWVLNADYSTRCAEGSCAQSLIQSHVLYGQLLSSGIIAGVVVSVFGTLLVIRSESTSGPKRIIV